MLRLRVPKAHEGLAVSHGALKLGKEEQYFAPTKTSYGELLPWIINQGRILVCNRLYLAEALCSCPRCHASTRAWVPVLESFFDFSSFVVEVERVVQHPLEYFYEGGTLSLHFCAPMYPMPSMVYKWAQEKLSISVERSEDFPGGESVMPCCDSCKAPITFRYLLTDSRSPFTEINKDKVHRLKLYRFDLPLDFVTQGRIVGEPISLALIDTAQIIPVDPESELLSTPPLNA